MQVNQKYNYSFKDRWKYRAENNKIIELNKIAELKGAITRNENKLKEVEDKKENKNYIQLRI